MATTKTNSTTTEIPEIATKVREQVLATVQQGQALTIDAAQNWVKAVSALPIPELPAVPSLPVPSVEAATTYVFDFASDLLAAQRDYALALTKTFASATSA